MTAHYIGTKEILGYESMKDGRYGYTVRYEDGYESWSPKATFEATYRVIEGPNQALTFGDAVHLLKRGKKVARAGWNGKGMFLFLVPGSTFKVNRAPLMGIYPEGTEVSYCPHIDMKTADGKVVPWLASQTDVLAEDWTSVD
ncbi:DUF2829 domain-containing protein [Ferrovum sp.]|uniref:DUF2829 domain-containing protein n=1 Tax=Ferrovum sp. TaxID=2609467 RepID=UPI00261BF39C|nr:DUF2829 domain-containing protein [Ferrovum sp.]